ncbi:hypothetical protein RKD41_002830 [Streptomyces tendae]
MFRLQGGEEEATGDTGGRPVQALLDMPAGEVEVDARLEQLVGVGHERRHRDTVTGVRVLRPVLRGPGAGLRAGVGRDQHHEGVVAPALLHVQILVAELLGDEGEMGELLHRGHRARELHGLTARDQPQHLLDLPLAHASPTPPPDHPATPSTTATGPVFHANPPSRTPD